MLNPPVIDRTSSMRTGERGRPAALLSRSDWMRASGPLMPLERPIAKPREQFPAPPGPAREGTQGSPPDRRRRVH